MCGAYVPCHYICASSLYVWSMCPMSLHTCQFSVCVEHVSHVITYVPVLCMCGACVPCHYIYASSVCVWSMCPMSLHTCQFCVCVEHVSHVITYVPVLRMYGACVPCHYIRASSVYVWSMCPMSLHTCQFCVCVEHVSHVITFMPVLYVCGAWISCYICASISSIYPCRWICCYLLPLSPSGWRGIVAHLRADRWLVTDFAECISLKLLNCFSLFKVLWNCLDLKLCNSMISETAGRIYTLWSSIELPRSVVLQQSWSFDPYDLPMGQNTSLKPLDRFSLQSSVELSWPVVEQRYGHLPLWPAWACPWIGNRIS